MRTARIASAVAAVVVALDQATKQWALWALDDGPIDVVWTLRFNLHFNSGAAFSFGAGRGGLIALLGIVALVVLLGSARHVRGRAGPVALGLVLGGAVGNLADRALRDGDGFLGGRVVDFVDFQWWPVFNVADIAVVAGAGLLVVSTARAPDPAPAAR